MMYKNIEWAKLAQYCDWINLMSYDFHGPFKGINDYDTVTGFNAALYYDPANKEANKTVNLNFNVNSAVQTLLIEGIPKSKINVGLPFYGRGYAGVEGNATNNGLYADYSSVPG